MTSGPMMTVGDEAGLALRCGQDALVALREPPAAAAAALVTAAALAVPLVLVAFPVGPFAGVVDAALRVAGGEPALHFPQAYAVFPRVLGLLGPGAMWLLGAPGVAFLVLALPRAIDGRRRERGAAGRAIAAVPAVLLASLPAMLLGTAGPLLRHGVESRVFGLPGMMADLLLSAAVVALGALVAYAVPAVLLGGANPLAALARSGALASRFPRVTVALLAVEALAAAIVAPAPSAVAANFDSLSPEIVPWLLAGGAVGLAFVGVVRLAVLTRLWLHAHGETAR